MSKVNIVDLKRIILEEALSLYEYVAKDADMSSDAESFDDPKKLKKMRDEAAKAIADLPVNHPDLANYVERMEGLLAGAKTEQDLRAVKDAADIWHDRARRLMKAKRGEYEQSDNMTEAQRSKKDGSRRAALKGALDQIRTEDATDVSHECWDGGGEDANNLVLPVDHAKRQSGIDTTDAGDPSEVMPVVSLDETIGDLSKSLAAGGKYSPADHFVRKEFSKMKSLAEVMDEDALFPPDVENVMKAATGIDDEEWAKYLEKPDSFDPESEEELDTALAALTPLDPEELGNLEAQEYAEEPNQLTNESKNYNNKWLIMAGINGDN